MALFSPCLLLTTLFSALRDLDNAIVRCMQVQVQVQVQVHACTRARVQRGYPLLPKRASRYPVGWLPSLQS